MLLRCILLFDYAMNKLMYQLLVRDHFSLDGTICGLVCFPIKKRKEKKLYSSVYQIINVSDSKNKGSAQILTNTLKIRRNNPPFLELVSPSKFVPRYESNLENGIPLSMELLILQKKKKKIIRS